MVPNKEQPADNKDLLEADNNIVEALADIEARIAADMAADKAVDISAVHIDDLVLVEQFAKGR